MLSEKNKVGFENLIRNGVEGLIKNSSSPEKFVMIDWMTSLETAKTSRNNGAFINVELKKPIF